MPISREKIWGKYQKIQKKKCTSEVYKEGDVAVHLIYSKSNTSSTTCTSMVISREKYGK